MKRIIAGATGLIGSKLANHWLNQGHEITIIGRSRQSINKTFQNRVQAIEWNELNPELFRNSEAVVNLAGASIGDKRWSQKRKQEILLSRIDSTVKLVSILSSLGKDAPALFNASAIGVYGLQKQSLQGLPPKLDEDTTFDWNSNTDFLSFIGREWEKATHPAHEKGVRVVNMRFGVVLSKDGGALPKIALPFYFFLGGPIGTGQQPFSWITFDDLIRAIDFLLENKQISGPINIVSPECVTQRDLAKDIGKVLHKPSFMPTPGFILEAIFGEMGRELLLEGQHVYPKRLLELGFQFSYPDIESALKHIYK